MSWTAEEVDHLLHRAFPWGAHLTVTNGMEFVSVSYGPVEDEVRDSSATVRFERDPGAMLGVVTAVQLELACTTGELTLDTGAHIRQLDPADLHLLASPFRDLLGSQSRSDAAWVARMRLHQSWWRTFRLRVPFGFGPQKGSTKRYGNMLDTAAAEAGANFISAEAHAAYHERVSATTRGVDPWRTSRNLLASQPMAFNLFGHLSKHLDIATQVFQTLLGVDEVSEVAHIEIERLSDALSDRTAFDAFATYRRPDGSPGCLAIETKLTEPFSQQVYDWDKYIAHSAFEPEVWTTTDPSILGDRRWSQLWRNHLLARAESAAHPELGPATVLVVHHPDDPHCATNVAGYRALLTKSDALRAIDIGVIADALQSIVADDPRQAEWLADFSDRYLSLRLSEPLVGIDDWNTNDH